MPKSRKPEKWFGCFSTISFIANLRCSTKDAKLLMVGLNNYIPIYSERLVSISKVPKFLYIYMFLYGPMEVSKIFKNRGGPNLSIYSKDFPWQTNLLGYHGPLSMPRWDNWSRRLSRVHRLAKVGEIPMWKNCWLLFWWINGVVSLGKSEDQDVPLIRWDVPKSDALLVKIGGPVKGIPSIINIINYLLLKG